MRFLNNYLLSKRINLLVACALSFWLNSVFAQQVEIKNPFESLALQGLFKESSLDIIEVDMNADGLKDLLVSVRQNASRGQNTWGLSLNKGDYYIDIPGSIDLSGSIEIRMIDGRPTIITVLPSGGGKAIKLAYFLNSNVVESEVIAEIITDGAIEVKELKAVVIGDVLEQVTRYDVGIEELVSVDIFNNLKSRKEDPYSLYFFKNDPDRLGTPWQIATDQKTGEKVGYFNYMTEELILLKDVDKEELENEKPENKKKSANTNKNAEAKTEEDSLKSDSRIAQKNNKWFLFIVFLFVFSIIVIMIYKYRIKK